jgi:hypothetical protein
MERMMGMRGTCDIKGQISILGKEIEKLLSAYAGAASAAGVSLLALTTAAHGKVVYTPANIGVASWGGWVQLDVNNDGTADFSFSITSTYRGSQQSIFRGRGAGQSNAIWGQGNFSWVGRGQHKYVFASALEPRHTVGPSKLNFQNGGSWVMGAARAWEHDGSNFGTLTYGQWLYTKDRYLGLKFLIDGQTHYGWARLSVPAWVAQGATITGYAYETIPNKPIITGKTKGPDVVILEPASLGRLAQGASAISLWRK